MQKTRTGRGSYGGSAEISPGAASPAPPIAGSNDSAGRRVRAFAAALAAGLLLWALANILFGGGGFAVIVSDSLRTSEEVASALVRFFAALVLVLFLSEEEGWRMGWVAAGLVALGFGHLAFGYLEPMIQGLHAGLDESIYEGLTSRICAGVLIAVGLLPVARPRLTVRVAAVVFVFATAASYIYIFEFLEGPGWVPALTIGSPERALELELDQSFGWITAWYMVISILPLGLAVAATAGAFRQSRRGVLPGWMLLAVVLLAGSSVHEYVWPTAYTGEVLATADLLRFLFAAVVAVGGVTELRRIGTERASLLAAEREHTRRLGELAALRAGFSAMVAHELGGPISAVRRLNEMLQAEGESPEVRGYATAAIEGEVGALDALVADVRAAAATERDDFEVKLRPIPLSDLLRDAEAYAAALPGGHAVELRLADGLDGERVWADRRRMAQVLNNLLSNAAKYSEEGTPIQLRARRAAGGVRVEVADHGPGIPPEEVARIFEKFGRGRRGKKLPGVGVGLYLSRRIVRSHGSDLTLDTSPGQGAVFGFELEVAR